MVAVGVEMAVVVHTERGKLHSQPRLTAHNGGAVDHITIPHTVSPHHDITDTPPAPSPDSPHHLSPHITSVPTSLVIQCADMLALHQCPSPDRQRRARATSDRASTPMKSLQHHTITSRYHSRYRRITISRIAPPIPPHRIDSAAPGPGGKCSKHCAAPVDTGLLLELGSLSSARNVSSDDHPVSGLTSQSCGGGGALGAPFVALPVGAGASAGGVSASRKGWGGQLR